MVRSDNCIIDAEIMYNSESVSQRALLEASLFADCPDMDEDIKVPCIARDNVKDLARGAQPSSLDVCRTLHICANRLLDRTMSATSPGSSRIASRP